MRWVRSGCAVTGGVPRQTAPQWNALARLVEPLDEAVAGLHHGDHVRFRRAGRQAAAIVLAHCADSGRSWWGWTPWEWARLCGGSAREFLTAQTPPTESTVRPYVVALAYLLGGFTDFHRLGTFNRFHLACLIFGEPAIDESMRGPARCSTGGDTATAPAQAPDAGGVQPGPAAQPQSAARRSGHRGVRRAAGASGHRRSPGIDAVCAAARSRRTRVTAIHRCAPVTTTLPTSRAPIRRGPNGSNAGMPPRR